MSLHPACEFTVFLIGERRLLESELDQPELGGRDLMGVLFLGFFCC